MSKGQKQKEQSMIAESQDSSKSKHGFKQTGNAGLQEGNRNTKGKK